MLKKVEYIDGVGEKFFFYVNDDVDAEGMQYLQLLQLAHFAVKDRTNGLIKCRWRVEDVIDKYVALTANSATTLT